MRTPRLPVVDRTDAPSNLNGLVRFNERRNLVSARVPSHFKGCLSPVMVFKTHGLHCTVECAAPSVSLFHADFRNREITFGSLVATITYPYNSTMQHTPSWEADYSSASQETPHISCNPNVHHHTLNSPPLFPTLGQINTVRDLVAFLQGPF